MSSDEEKNLPLAERLRRQQKSESKTTRRAEAKQDIDDEIKRLEAELADDSEDSDSSSSSDSSDESSDDDRPRKVRFGKDSVKEIPSRRPARDPSEQAVISLSSLAQHRIAPLPESALPKIRKKRGSEDKLGSKPKKAKKMDGLELAVKEVLSGYVARSSERLPFYCRVCAKQYDNKEEFFAHKQTDFHKTAVEAERKISYCKLCQKQFTSPVQLKEHLTSRPHKEKLHRVRQGNRASRGRGRAGRGNRQWC